MFLGLDIVIGVVVLYAASRTSVGRRAVNLAQQKFTHLLDRAENPVEALDLSYQKQLEALQQVRRGVAEVVTSEKRLELQAAQLRQNQEKLQGQAKLAVQQGRDDLARLALTRSHAADTQLQSLDQQVQQLKDQEQKLQITSQKLQARVEAFRTQRDTLKAQYSAAQASARIGEAVTGISDQMTDVNLMLERAQDKTSQMQARAAAIDQLVSSGTLDAIGSSGGDDIDRQLQAGATDAAVEAQLTKLRQEVLAKPVDQQRLGAADPSTDPTQEGG
ncbi:MAG TPA: PspA/IM30 family protein [Candidatus Saccharimonadales bacterium]|nr:PspA/IM30 family protein [Candidatus Saccharimonadales bacterium]